MLHLEAPPSWIVNLFTLGIARARWISDSNRRIGQGGAGFWFAWFLMPFANYGLAQRMTGALRQAGSSFTVSAFWCFWLAGWPFIGSAKRFKRGTQTLNDTHSIRQRAAASKVA